MTDGNLLVLIIEDDDLLGKTVSQRLKRENYQVKHVSNGIVGLKVAREYKPDLIILDIVMQGKDGYTICEEIRADPIINNTPVLFLNAIIEEDSQVRGLRDCTDDYLTKPFNIDELCFRVGAILRRTQSVSNSVTNFDDSTNPIPLDGGLQYSTKTLDFIEVGDYQLDVRSNELNTPHNGKVLLTPIQYQLIYYLITHVDMVFSPAKLLESVWNFPSDIGSTDLVRVHIKNLRKRIELDPVNPTFIQTVPGYGYTVKSPT